MKTDECGFSLTADFISFKTVWNNASVFIKPEVHWLTVNFPICVINLSSVLHAVDVHIIGVFLVQKYAVCIFSTVHISTHQSQRNFEKRY